MIGIKLLMRLFSFLMLFAISLNIQANSQELPALIALPTSTASLAPSVIARRNAYATLSANCGELKEILTKRFFEDLYLFDEMGFSCSPDGTTRPRLDGSLSCTLSRLVAALKPSTEQVIPGREKAAAVLLKKLSEAKIGLPACGEGPMLRHYILWQEPAAQPAPANIVLRTDVPAPNGLLQKLMDLYDQASTPTLSDFAEGVQAAGRCYTNRNDKPLPFAVVGKGMVSPDNGPLLPRTYLTASVFMEKGHLWPELFDDFAHSDFARDVYLRPIAQDGSLGNKRVRIKKLGDYLVVKVLNENSCAGGYSTLADPDECAIERMCYTFINGSEKGSRQ